MSVTSSATSATSRTSGKDLLGVFKVWEGGISLIGGITGAILFALPYMTASQDGVLAHDGPRGPRAGARDHHRAYRRSHHRRPPGQADGLRPGVALLSGSGGDPPIDSRQLPAGGRGRELSRLSDASTSTLHQTALYDFGWTILLLVSLLWVGRKTRNTGFLILVFTSGTASMRVVTDFLRVDKRYFGLTGSQLMTLAVGVIALYLLARLQRGAAEVCFGAWRPAPRTLLTQVIESPWCPSGHLRRRRKSYLSRRVTKIPGIRPETTTLRS